MVKMIKCPGCGKEEEHHGKGYCYNCYKKFGWKRKKINCKRCGREIPNHAKGLCAGCYNFVFHLDKNKAWNQRNNFGLDYKKYKGLTKKCIICGFDKIVELHHLDENRQNNSEKNLVALCPNHHKMIHNFGFRKEIRNLLKQKGIVLPIDKKLDFKFSENNT